jgi:hypothetical protein
VAVVVSVGEDLDVVVSCCAAAVVVGAADEPLSQPAMTAARQTAAATATVRRGRRGCLAMRATIAPGL